MRISRYTVKCVRCGTELKVYPRHIEHKEPIVCPSCGRRNSADEYDFKDQMAVHRRELEQLLKRKS